MKIKPANRNFSISTWFKLSSKEVPEYITWHCFNFANNVSSSSIASSIIEKKV
jgi:hypothetical protein